MLDIANILNPMESRFAINNWEGFEELLFTLKQSALKWSDVAQDITGMDALLNGDTDEKVCNRVRERFYKPYALIVARLANNPNFEELATSLGINGKGCPARTKTSPAIAWPKLVNYLRDEVKPLI